MGYSSLLYDGHSVKLNTITIHSQECIIARTLEHVTFAGCNSPRIGIRTRIVLPCYCNRLQVVTVHALALEHVLSFALLL